MSTATRLSLLAAATLASALASSAGAQTVYAIGGGGSQLVRFDASNPGAVTVVGGFGGANTFLDAIDFRPATGELYGYLDAADAFFTVNLTTAALTLVSVGASGAPTNTFQLGMDFNPTIDRLRVITDSDQNLVYNPGPGTAAGFTSLNYLLGGPQQDVDPNIIDIAYNNNYVGAPTSQQYGIDYGTNSLVTVANNAGTLVTVGSLGVDTDIYTGFDIFTAPNGTNTGYAILGGLSSGPSFYTIDLATGQATLVGSVGVQDPQVYSLAVIPSPGALVLAGIAALGAGRRRRA